MRKKPNLLPRLARCAAVFLDEPEALRGRWLEAFPGYDGLSLELGCGKGRFTAEFAASHPERLVVGLERVPEALVVAMERALALETQNLRFVGRDARLLPQLFAPGEISELLINFCDPWPRNRDWERRLSSPGFLKVYAELLADGGDLRFRTDNRPLFDYTLLQLRKAGWALQELSFDLHEGGVLGIMTDYEEKFYGQGIPICQVTAKRGVPSACA